MLYTILSMVLNRICLHLCFSLFETIPILHLFWKSANKKKRIIIVENQSWYYTLKQLNCSLNSSQMFDSFIYTSLFSHFNKELIDLFYTLGILGIKKVSEGALTKVS